LLVRDPVGDSYLIWRHRRHLVREPAFVLGALGWGSQPQAPIAAAVLDALPPGGDLARIPVEGRGRPSAMAGLRVGEVVVVESQGGGRQYAVVLPAGLAGITQVQADLLLAERRTRLRRLDPSAYAVAPKLGDLVPAGDAPEETPALVRPSGAVCVDISTDAVEVRVDVPFTGPAGVVVTPGWGAVFEADGRLSLVTGCPADSQTCCPSARRSIRKLSTDP
jgi:hypothetical protein